jgi:peptide chain release factor subunit 1
MTATASLRDVFRRLADSQSHTAPVLSVYLDMRPQATGESPGLRSGSVVLRNRLRSIEKSLGPRGEALESFLTDATRIQRFLEEDLSAAAQGVALFACASDNLFDVVEAGVAFDNQVSATSRPDLFQLARLLDEQETSLIAVVDTNTARLFVTRTGVLDEVGGSDDDSVHYRKRKMGGWSQARYQRHIDKHRDDFAREAAAEIERVAVAEGARRIVLAGDELSVPRLRAAMPEPLSRLVIEEVPRIHIRTSRREVAEEVMTILAVIEAEEALSIANRVVQADRAGGLGVVGADDTRAALDGGQVDVLVVSDAAAVSEAQRAELIRLAAQTGAEVEVVSGADDFLAASGGVGALLRFRHT